LTTNVSGAVDFGRRMHFYFLPIEMLHI